MNRYLLFLILCAIIGIALILYFAMLSQGNYPDNVFGPLLAVA